MEEALTGFARAKLLAQNFETALQGLSPEAAWASLQKRNIHFTCPGYATYPERLIPVPDAPFGLYYLGELPSAKKPTVAIIGARNCSEYGRQVATTFGRDLATAGIQIISGMARGIDGISQQAAVDAGGYSLGVLGSGVDVCYPDENRKLYEALRENGGICSEYVPGTEPQSNLFPPRNRIISGFADVVLVIEARKRSGTLITVDMALEQGREVYALPGRVTDALSEGCNRLLMQGASMALSPGELIQDMLERFYTPDKSQKNNRCYQIEKKETVPSVSPLSDIEADILHSLDTTPEPVEKIRDRLISSCGRELSLQELLQQLVRLTLLGLARQIGNSYFGSIT